VALDPPPPIYFDWIGLRRPAGRDGATDVARSIAESFPRGRRVIASDPWQAVALDGHGFRKGSEQPWMARAAAPLAAALTPRELDVEEVRRPDALATFEATSLAGFEAPPHAPFTFHGPGVLADPRARLLTGRVRGRPVATAMSFVEAGVVAVYGVATVPHARRRGYATALTALAIEAAPALPAVLQPSAAAEPLYARLGFRRFASFDTWVREGER
jgi:GNAT superfamily N-acetyltransferase